MNTWQKTSLVAGALVLAGSLTWGGIAYAQTATPTADASAQTQQTPAHRPEQRPGGIFGFLQRFGGPRSGRFGGPLGRLGDGPFHDEGQAILAEALGMTQDELQTALASGQTPLEIAQSKGMDQSAFQNALKAAAEKQLAADVKAGKITQAQADAMLKQLDNGLPFFGAGPRGGMFGGPHAGMFGARRGGMFGGVFGEGQAILAEALGMSQDELQSALAAGQTPLEIAQSKGMDQSAFQDALKAAAEKQLAADVKAGKITQAQADAMLKQLDNGLPFFGMGPRGGMFGAPRGGMFGGSRGGHFGGPRGGHQRGPWNGRGNRQPGNGSNWQPATPAPEQSGQNA